MNAKRRSTDLWKQGLKPIYLKLVIKCTCNKDCILLRGVIIEKPILFI